MDIQTLIYYLQKEKPYIDKKIYEAAYKVWNTA